jgi:hypothetical protein
MNGLVRLISEVKTEREEEIAHVAQHTQVIACCNENSVMQWICQEELIAQRPALSIYLPH